MLGLGVYMASISRYSCCGWTALVQRALKMLGASHRRNLVVPRVLVVRLAVLLTVETHFLRCSSFGDHRRNPGLQNLLYKPWAITLSPMLPLDHHQRNPVALKTLCRACAARLLALQPKLRCWSPPHHPNFPESAKDVIRSF